MHARFLTSLPPTPVLAAALLCACGSSDDPAGGADGAPRGDALSSDDGGDPGGAPPGADTDDPYPIDRGDDGPETPGTYKGLWLRLADTGAPELTAVDGIIGVVCIGMSNSNQECADYVAKLAADEWTGEVAAQVRVVNCAVGGHAIERWNDPADDGTLWDACIDSKLGAAGVAPDQVRVLYRAHPAASVPMTPAMSASSAGSRSISSASASSPTRRRTRSRSIRSPWSASSRSTSCWS